MCTFPYIVTAVGELENQFWHFIIKVNNFAFDKGAVFMPETNCLDCLVAEFPESIGQPRTTVEWMGRWISYKYSYLSAQLKQTWANAFLVFTF